MTGQRRAEPGSAQVATALRRLLGTDRAAAVGIACTLHPGPGAAARISRILDMVPLM